MARVNRERVLLVGGQRALVMQLAHPLVAAGVAHHSDFPARASERLRRTLDLSLTLIYGTPEEAEAAAASIRAVHDRVTGIAEGVAYRANHPGLLQWVNATLIDTTLLIYDTFVRPLGEVERRRYYAESLDSAEVFGIPRRIIPPDIDSFNAYMREMLTGDELRATEDGRRLVRDILSPPVALPFRPPTVLASQITLALLPDRLRRMFGLRAGPTARAALGTASALSRLALPWLPPVVREFSKARASTLGDRPHDA
jgi:uncharacterized protein (DUF2236 family)